MAKLSIGIGVDLGTSLQGINSLIASLTVLNTEVSKLSTSLNSIKNIKVNPTVTVTTNNVNKNSTINSSTGSIYQPTLRPVPDIFADYRNGLIQAATVTEFLKSKQAQLQNGIAKLHQVLGNVSSIKRYEDALYGLAIRQKQLDQVNKSLGNSGNIAAGGLNRLSGAGNQANMVLTNVGRIAQDSAFGILGISNNINPLIESFSQLKLAATASGQTMTQALGSALTSAGGLTLAFSLVTAALSFAAVGLSYWESRTAKAKDEVEKFADALEKAKIAATTQAIELQNLLDIASNTSLPLDEQKAALDKLNSSVSQYGINLNDIQIKNGNAQNAVSSLTEALIQQSVAAEGFKELGKLYVERAKLTKDLTEKTNILNKATKKNKGTETYSTVDFVDGVFTVKQTPKPTVQGQDYLLASKEVKLATDAIELNAASISKINETTNAASALASAAFRKAIPPSAFTSRIVVLNKSIADQIALQNNLTGTYQEQKAKYEDINKQIKIYQAELDKIQGKEKSGGIGSNNAKAKTYKDLIAEVYADIKKINESPVLSIEEKNVKTLFALQGGLLNISDLWSQAFKDDKTGDIAKLTAIFKDFEQRKIQFDYKKSYNEIFSDLKKLSDLEVVDGKSRTEDKLKRLLTGAGYLVDTFGDLAKKDPKFIELTALINDLQKASALKNVVKSFNDINDSIYNIQKRGKILNLATTEDELKVLKDGIDKVIAASQLGLFKDPTIQPFFALLFDNIQQRINKLDIKKFKEGLRSIKTKNFFIGDPVSEAKETVDLFKSELTKELSKPTPNITKVIALTFTIKNVEKDIKAFELGKAIGEIISAGVTNGLGDLSEAIGTAIGEGGNVFKALKNSILGSLADIVIAIGKQLLIANKLVLAAKAFFAQGPLGIIAAIALITAGYALKASIKTKFATGGYVSGPGSGTSDSIPAMLSNREYVVKASSVDKYGVGFMNRLNSGSFDLNKISKFAKGGIVGFAEGGLVSSGGDKINLEDTIRTDFRALVNRVKDATEAIGTSFEEVALSLADATRTNFRALVNRAAASSEEVGLSLEELSKTNFRALVNRAIIPTVPGANMGSFQSPKISLGNTFGQQQGFVAETKISGQDLKLVLNRADRRFNNVT